MPQMKLLFENVKNLKPSEDMFFDNMHLNNKRGLPEIVKHLKTALNMYPKTSETYS